ACLLPENRSENRINTTVRGEKAGFGACDGFQWLGSEWRAKPAIRRRDGKEIGPQVGLCPTNDHDCGHGPLHRVTGFRAFYGPKGFWKSPEGDVVGGGVGG